MAGSHLEKCSPADRASFGYLHCRILLIEYYLFTFPQKYNNKFTRAKKLHYFFQRSGQNP